jgi:riboflavin synthase
MFTGLIETLGRVERIERTPAGIRLKLSAPLDDELALGESVAVNGVCLTVSAADQASCEFDVSPETARVTTLGALATGAPVNLERSLRAGARIGGHFVQGHVDGVGAIEAIREEGESYRVTVSLPSGLEPYVVHKGSIAVDGISLTVAALYRHQFDVQVIPFTWQHTNLKNVGVGHPVNIECDILGKYVARAIELRG